MSARTLLLCSVLLTVASGTGKGPIGLYAINSRLVLVAESNQDALLLIDVARGGVVARREFTGEGVSVQRGAARRQLTGSVSVTGVASCASCDWALVTSNRGAKLWTVRFDAPLAAARDDAAMAVLLAGSTIAPTLAEDEPTPLVSAWLRRRASIEDDDGGGRERGDGADADADGAGEVIQDGAAVLGSTRCVCVRRDGTRAYVAGFGEGIVWTFETAPESRAWRAAPTLWPLAARVLAVDSDADGASSGAALGDPIGVSLDHDGATLLVTLEHTSVSCAAFTACPV